MWHIFRCRGFYLIYRRPDGKLYFSLDNMNVKDTYDIQDNIRDLREQVLTDAQQDVNVAQAAAIVNATKNNSI